MFHQDETTLLRTYTVSLLLLFTLLAAHNTQPNITHSTWLLSYISFAAQMGRIGT